MTLHIKFERNLVSGVPDIHSRKWPIFHHIFLLLILLRIAFNRIFKNNVSIHQFLSNLVHQ